MKIILILHPRLQEVRPSFRRPCDITRFKFPAYEDTTLKLYVAATKNFQWACWL